MTANPSALYLEHPLDLDDARRAARRLAELRRDAEHEHERLVREAADAEHAYRLAYSAAMLKAEAPSAGAREAIAKAASAGEARDRDIAQGLAKAAVERLRGLEGERSMLKSLIEWSARLNVNGDPDPRQEARR